MKKFATGFLIFILCIHFSVSSLAHRYGADSFTQPRIPAAMQTILIFLLQMSNLREGIGELPKQRYDRDQQLEILLNLVTILEAVYDKPKVTYNRKQHGEIRSLRDFIKLTEPLRVDTDSLTHDFDEIMRMKDAGELKVPVDITLEMVRDDETLIPDNHTRSQVIRYLSAQREQLNGMYKRGTSLSGMVFGHVLGQSFALAEDVAKVGDTLSVINSTGLLVDAVHFFQSFQQKVFAVGEGGLGLVMTRASKEIPGSGLDRPVGSNVPEVLKEAVDRVKNATTFDDISAKFVKFFIKTKKDPHFQEKVIVRFESIFNGLIEKFKDVGTRIANSADVQQALKEDKQARTMMRTFELFLNEYPGQLPSDVWKTLLRVLVFSDEDEGSDIATFGRMADHFDPNFKNLLQFLAEYVEYPPLKRVLERQQSEGQTMPFSLAKKEIEREATKNGYVLSDIDPTPIGSGKSFTVYKGDFQPADGRKPKKVAIRIMLPDAERKAKIGQKILLSFSKKIADVFNRDPDLMESPLDAKVIEQIIEVVTENTKRELNVPLTVINQMRVGARWNVSKPFKLRNKVVLVNFRTPQVEPVVEGSKMMLSDLVEEPMNLDELRREEGEAVTRLVGGMAYSTFVDQGILKPLLLVELRRQALARALKESRAEFETNAPPALDSNETDGALNTDLHRGNLLFKVRSSTAAACREHVPVSMARDPEEVLVVEAYMVDHGLDSWVTLPQAEAIMTLCAAAEFNHVQGITLALWDLQDESAINGTTGEPFEKKEIEARRAKLYQAVYDKAWQLHREKKYWPVSKWIKFSLKYLTLHHEIISVDRGSTAVSSFAKSAGLTDRDLRNAYGAFNNPTIRGILYGLLKKKIGYWGLFGLAREKVISSWRGCAPELAVAGGEDKE